MQPGSVVGPDFVNARELLPPVVTDSRELGWKWASGATSVNIALYDNKSPNDVGVPVESGSNLLRLERKGLQRYRGVEINAASQWGALELGVGLVNQRAKTVSSEDPAFDNTDVVGALRRSATLNAKHRSSAVVGLETSAALRLYDRTSFDQVERGAPARDGQAGATAPGGFVVERAFADQ